MAPPAGPGRGGRARPLLRRRAPDRARRRPADDDRRRPVVGHGGPLGPHPGHERRPGAVAAGPDGRGQATDHDRRGHQRGTGRRARAWPARCTTSRSSPRPASSRRCATRSPDAVAATKRLFGRTWAANDRRTFARERLEQARLLATRNTTIAREAAMARARAGVRAPPQMTPTPIPTHCGNPPPCLVRVSRRRSQSATTSGTSPAPCARRSAASRSTVDRTARIAVDPRRRRDPLSRGHICPKAVALQDLHDDPDRLRRPVRRTATAAGSEIAGTTAFDRGRRRAGRDAARARRRRGRRLPRQPQRAQPRRPDPRPALLRGCCARATGSPPPRSTSCRTSSWRWLLYGHQFLLPVPGHRPHRLFLVLGRQPDGLERQPDDRARLPRRRRELRGARRPAGRRRPAPHRDRQGRRRAPLRPARAPTPPCSSPSCTSCSRRVLAPPGRPRDCRRRRRGARAVEPFTPERSPSGQRHGRG